MRKHLCMLAALALSAGLLVVAPGEAQQAGTAAGQGNPAGQFFNASPPTIVNKPIDISGASKPLSFQNVMTPQQLSTKVTTVNSAFHTMSSPIFKSTIPNTPMVRPGVNNPLQPTPAIQLPTPKPSSTKLFGFIPWF